MINALIFDFDGVLVSSEEPRFKAVQAMAASHGIKLKDSAIKRALGKTTLNFMQEMIPDNPELVATLYKEFKSEYVANIIDYVLPIDFIVDFIHNYDGTLPIAIASMSSPTSIEKLTKHFGIFSKIAHIITRDDVIHYKPNPEIYVKTASILNISPNECLVFEDTVVGVQAALNAEMPSCVVLNGLNNKKQFEGMNIYDFIADKQDLLELIKKI